VGSIVIDLARIMKERGVVSHGFVYEGYPNLSALERGTGLAHNTVYSLLRHPENVQQVSLPVLARICEFLHCQPSDILRYSPVRRGA
jgi:DNA-binding Xre family transcriptional regulator